MSKAIMIVFSLVCFTMSGCSSSECIPPTVEEFDSANATKYYDPELKKEVSFTIEKEDWESIRKALLPAKPEPEHPKRDVFVELNIKTLSGSPCRITLFRNGTESVAFSVRKSYKIYYLGGNSTAIEKALKTAYDKSQKKKQ